MTSVKFTFNLPTQILVPNESKVQAIFVFRRELVVAAGPCVWWTPTGSHRTPATNTTRSSWSIHSTRQCVGMQRSTGYADLQWSTGKCAASLLPTASLVVLARVTSSTIPLVVPAEPTGSATPTCNCEGSVNAIFFFYFSLQHTVCSGCHVWTVVVLKHLVWSWLTSCRYK